MNRSSQIPVTDRAAPMTGPAVSGDVGLMQGFPPPPDKRVTRDTMMQPHFLRWRGMNQSRLLPTARVSRGEAPIVPLTYGRQLDVDALSFVDRTGSTMPMPEMFLKSGVDALLVMHRGEVVYERYFGEMTATTHHSVYSCTKSFVGLLAEWLIQEQQIERHAPAERFIPELAGTAIGAATVQQLLDMRAHFDFGAFPPREPGKIQVGYLMAMGFLKPRPDYAGPFGAYEVLASNVPTVPHGGQFRYDNGTTDTLAWIVRRVSGKSIDQLISARIWSKLGAEQDATMCLDAAGTEWAAAGLSMTLRDAARFAEMVRNGGACFGHQVVPSAVIAEIRQGGDPAAFTADPLAISGGSYHNQWWFFHDEFESFAAKGQYAQRMWIAPVAETVVVQFSADPDTSGDLEPMRLQAWRAIARALVQR